LVLQSQRVHLKSQIDWSWLILNVLQRAWQTDYSANTVEFALNKKNELDVLVTQRNLDEKVSKNKNFIICEFVDIKADTSFH
jgi:hypothetical protein